MLLNPSKRKKPRTAAQKAATKRLVALNKHKHVAPAKKRATRTITVKSNPVRRRRRLAAGASSAKGLVKAAIVPAAMAGAGALGLDIVMGYVNKYLPANMQSGTGGTIAKLGGAVVLGMIIEKAGKKELAKQVMVGSMTVTIHDLLKSYFQTSMPTVPLAGVGVYNDLALYNDNVGVGFYSPGMVAGLGQQKVGASMVYEEYDERGNLIAS